MVLTIALNKWFISHYMHMHPGYQAL